MFVLHNVELSQVDGDIWLFYRHKLLELQQTGPLTEEQLDLLCKCAGGFFIHATAAVRFISQKNKNPRKQLDLLLQLPESGFKGRTKLKEHATLDSLYWLILQEAFCNDIPEDDHNIHSVHELPDDCDMMLGSGSVKLTGGQKQ